MTLLVFLLAGCGDDLQIVPLPTYAQWIADVCPFSYADLEANSATTATQTLPPMPTQTFVNEGTYDGVSGLHTTSSIVSFDSQATSYQLDETQLEDPASHVPQDLSDNPPPAGMIDFVACDHTVWSGPATVRVQIEQNEPVVLTGDLEIRGETPGRSLFMGYTLRSEGEVVWKAVEYIDTGEQTLEWFDDGIHTWELYLEGL